MDISIKKQQCGITLGGVLIAAFLLVIGGIFGLKLVPAYMEYGKIKSVFNQIVHAPDMQKAPPSDIKASFDKRASIENIKAIKSNEIDISTNQGKIFLSASYSVIVPLGGNVSLYLEFNPTSAE